mmetsp:Transcript_2475/g.6916  ORF Transcript_2475/g.6916 Transcript_2475/m.6916 type:complete len:82 (+) Transcript_2475:353-598(+)
MLRIMPRTHRPSHVASPPIVRPKAPTAAIGAHARAHALPPALIVATVSSAIVQEESAPAVCPRLHKARVMEDARATVNVAA